MSCSISKVAEVARIGAHGEGCGGVQMAEDVGYFAGVKAMLGRDAVNKAHRRPK